MPKTREQKEQELTVLKEKYDSAKGVVFANFMGLNVGQAQTLRRALREENSEMVVAKKSLMGLLMEHAGFERSTAKSMEGGVAMVLGYNDEVAPAKVVAEFAKDHEVVTFHGGVLDGEFIGTEQVVALSKLPSKQELLGKMVGSLKSPISGFVNVLGGNTRGLVQVLSQIKEQKEAA